MPVWGAESLKSCRLWWIIEEGSVYRTRTRGMQPSLQSWRAALKQPSCVARRPSIPAPGSSLPFPSPSWVKRNRLKLCLQKASFIEEKKKNSNNLLLCAVPGGNLRHPPPTRVKGALEPAAKWGILQPSEGSSSRARDAPASPSLARLPLALWAGGAEATALPKPSSLWTREEAWAGPELCRRLPGGMEEPRAPLRWRRRELETGRRGWGSGSSLCAAEGWHRRAQTEELTLDFWRGRSGLGSLERATPARRVTDPGALGPRGWLLSLAQTPTRGSPCTRKRLSEAPAAAQVPAAFGSCSLVLTRAVNSVQVKLQVKLQELFSTRLPGAAMGPGTILQHSVMAQRARAAPMGAVSVGWGARSADKPCLQRALSPGYSLRSPAYPGALLLRPSGKPARGAEALPPRSSSRAHCNDALRQKGFPNCSVKPGSFPCQSRSAQPGSVTYGKWGLLSLVCTWNLRLGWADGAALGIANGLRTQSVCAPESALRCGSIDFLAVGAVYLAGQLGSRQRLVRARGGNGSAPSQSTGTGVGSGVWGGHSFGAAAPGSLRGQSRGKKLLKMECFVL